MTSRPRVQRLPEHVANQIAAGEVVARPASVVKELVENALDAGARTVVVAIEGGGVSLVRVVDDGAGMDGEDARAALERHATSKLRSADDLRTLRTLGFRGEALPSIASVSRFTLRTRTAKEDEGTELTVDGNGEVQTRPCGTPVGTTIEVRELFFNVPARRKFLRALATESAHVGDALRETAFAHPGVQFELWRDGRLHKRWLRESGTEARARDILGAEVTLRVAETRGPLSIEAYLSPPERVRSGATGLTILVNRRPVQDRAIARAVATAYGDRIERGKYPLGVVMLELPTEDCDVNVHPQKSEVRFSEPRAVCDAVFGSVQRALAEATTTTRSVSPLGSGAPARHASHGFPRAQPAASWARATETASVREASEAWTWTRPSERAPHTTGPVPSTAAHPAREEPRPHHETKPSALTFLTAIDGVLVARDARYVLFIDRHAARARVTEHRAATSLARGALDSKPLLFPCPIELNGDLVANLEAHQDELERLGFELHVTGPRTVAVHAVAAVWSSASAEALVRSAAELATTLTSEHGRRAFLAKASDLAAGAAQEVAAQTLLDAWYESLAETTPRDAAETRHHVPLSELTSTGRRG
jgi:DNA mismatch repair protein MutL